MCPDLVVTGKYGRQNPFFVAPAWAAYIRPAVAEMVVSTALGHRILQGVNRSSSERGALATKLQHHRGAAIRLMAEELTHDAMQASDELLVCVLVFLLAEVSFISSSHSIGEQNIDSYLDSTIYIIKLATTCRCGGGHCQRSRWPCCTDT